MKEWWMKNDNNVSHESAYLEFDDVINKEP